MRGHIAKKGNRYYIVVRIEDEQTGKSKPKWMPGGYDLKRDAEKALPGILQSLQQGPYIAPSDEPLSDYMLRWLEKKKTSVRPATWSSYSWLIKSHLIPHLGKTILPKLKRDHFHDLYHKKLLPTLAVASIKKLHVLVVAALNEARLDGSIKLNPAEGVELPRGQKPKFEVWNEEQLELFLEEAKEDQYFEVFELAASTGMRKSEILGMPRSDVFLDTAVMSVRQAYTKGEDGYEIDDTKNNSSVRPVPLFDSTVDYLRAHLTQQELERAKPGYNDHGLLFQTSTGTPIYQRNLMRNYYRIIRRVIKQQEKQKAAGKPYVEFKPIRFHDLRHTHATILLKNGVHPKIVQERLGHSSIQVTLNTYSHVIPNLQESILKSIGTSITGGKGAAAKLLNETEKSTEPVLSVDYDSGRPETYRSITIDWEGKQSRISTGDFYRDLGYVQAEYSPFKTSESFDKFMAEMKQKKP